MKMGHVCGLKYSKAEYQAVQKGEPPPQSSCSSIAKELEKDYPKADPHEIYALIGQRLGEMELKRKYAESGTIQVILLLLTLVEISGSRSPSTAATESPRQSPSSPNAKRRRTTK